MAALIDRKKLTLAHGISPGPEHPLSAKQEAALFAEAMADVTPLLRDRHLAPPSGRAPASGPCDREEQETVACLTRLVKCGEGFVVAQTAEYMEVTGPGACPEIARRLHQGRYAIQDHIDLHGLRVPQAEAALHDFIRQSLKTGYRTVLVIHGRGLTSPRRPVLKFKVYQWLTRGPLRKHIIAMTSARSCDGGAGATYVLMRHRPLTKRFRKRWGVWRNSIV
jgi:DNA-nicking Smr family endonuclease